VGQRAGHLYEQRGEKDVGAFQVRVVPEDVQPGPLGGARLHALAAQGQREPSEQMALDVAPGVVQREDAVGGLVGLGAKRAEERPVDAVAGHELGGLGGQCLGLGRGAALVFGLGE
jgi:hypothetical protein